MISPLKDKTQTLSIVAQMMVRGITVSTIIGIDPCRRNKLILDWWLLHGDNFRSSSSSCLI
jgi:hypothetical protein